MVIQLKKFIKRYIPLHFNVPPFSTRKIHKTDSMKTYKSKVNGPTEKDKDYIMKEGNIINCDTKLENNLVSDSSKCYDTMIDPNKQTSRILNILDKKPDLNSNSAKQTQVNGPNENDVDFIFENNKKKNCDSEIEDGKFKSIIKCNDITTKKQSRKLFKRFLRTSKKIYKSSKPLGKSSLHKINGPTEQDKDIIYNAGQSVDCDLNIKNDSLKEIFDCDDIVVDSRHKNYFSKVNGPTEDDKDFIYKDEGKVDCNSNIEIDLLKPVFSCDDIVTISENYDHAYKSKNINGPSEQSSDFIFENGKKIDCNDKYEFESYNSYTSNNCDDIVPMQNLTYYKKIFKQNGPTELDADRIIKDGKEIDCEFDFSILPGKVSNLTCEDIITNGDKQTGVKKNGPTELDTDIIFKDGKEIDSDTDFSILPGKVSNLTLEKIKTKGNKQPRAKKRVNRIKQKDRRPPRFDKKKHSHKNLHEKQPKKTDQSDMRKILKIENEDKNICNQISTIKKIKGPNEKCRDLIYNGNSFIDSERYNQNSLKNYHKSNLINRKSAQYKQYNNTRVNDSNDNIIDEIFNNKKIIKCDTNLNFDKSTSSINYHCLDDINKVSENDILPRNFTQKKVKGVKASNKKGKDIIFDNKSIIASNRDLQIERPTSSINPNFSDYVNKIYEKDQLRRNFTQKFKGERVNGPNDKDYDIIFNSTKDINNGINMENFPSKMPDYNCNDTVTSAKKQSNPASQDNIFSGTDDQRLDILREKDKLVKKASEIKKHSINVRSFIRETTGGNFSLHDGINKTTLNDQYLGEELINKLFPQSSHVKQKENKHINFKNLGHHNLNNLNGRADSTNKKNKNSMIIEKRKELIEKEREKFIRKVMNIKSKCKSENQFQNISKFDKNCDNVIIRLSKNGTVKTEKCKADKDKLQNANNPINRSCEDAIEIERLNYLNSISEIEKEYSKGKILKVRNINQINCEDSIYKVDNFGRLITELCDYNIEAPIKNNSKDSVTYKCKDELQNFVKSNLTSEIRMNGTVKQDNADCKSMNESNYKSSNCDCIDTVIEYKKDKIIKKLSNIQEICQHQTSHLKNLSKKMREDCKEILIKKNKKKILSRNLQKKCDNLSVYNAVINGPTFDCDDNILYSHKTKFLNKMKNLNNCEDKINFAPKNPYNSNINSNDHFRHHNKSIKNLVEKCGNTSIELLVTSIKENCDDDVYKLDKNNTITKVRCDELLLPSNKDLKNKFNDDCIIEIIKYKESAKSLQDNIDQNDLIKDKKNITSECTDSVVLFSSLIKDQENSQQFNNDHIKQLGRDKEVKLINGPTDMAKDIINLEIIKKKNKIRKKKKLQRIEENCKEKTSGQFNELDKIISQNNKNTISQVVMDPFDDVDLIDGPDHDSEDIIMTDSNLKLLSKGKKCNS